MTEKQKNKVQGTGYRAEIKIMISGLSVVSQSYGGGLLNSYLFHGASGIACHNKLSGNLEEVLLLIIAINTFIESSFLSFI